MGLLSSVFGGLASSAQALWNQKEKGRDRQYATKMSNTAHQREVADLRRAGLNPILSAGGSGASTPSIGSIGAPDVAGNISKLTQASTARKAAAANIDYVRANAANTRAALPGIQLDGKLAAATDAWLTRNPAFLETAAGANAARRVGLSGNYGGMAGAATSSKQAWEANTGPGFKWGPQPKPDRSKVGPPLRKDLKKGEKWTPYNDFFFNKY